MHAHIFLDAQTAVVKRGTKVDHKVCCIRLDMPTAVTQRQMSVLKHTVLFLFPLKAAPGQLGKKITLLLKLGVVCIAGARASKVQQEHDPKAQHEAGNVLYKDHSLFLP